MTVIDLLSDIVKIPSVSGEEHACRDYLVAWLQDRGVKAWSSGRNVIGVREGHTPGRGLLLLTHIDVVPVGDGWTRDPWDGAVENGFVHGRGSNDAKSSAAAMAWVAAHLRADDICGRLVVALVCDEETGGEGIEACGDELPEFHATVVGEPTELDVCPGQRGLFRATLTVNGHQCHASRPWEGENAIVEAAREILALEDMDKGEPDPLLGPATLEATVIGGGTRPNVLPGRCTIELDGRPTPTFDNKQMEAAVHEALDCDIQIRSNRFLPVRTSRSEEIVARAVEASPTGRVRAFGGVSDLFHVRHVPGVVMGPGTSAASHAANESVAVVQVEAAVAAYDAIARGYLNSEAS